MSLVPDYGGSSSESDASSESPERPPEKNAPRLPRPDFLGNDPDVSTASVFKNPFSEAENAKEAILQKHVKMSDTKDNTIVINGKRICWNYRKGKCRFGHKCKFAHDSDLQKTEEQLSSERKALESVVCETSISQPSLQELDKIKQEAIKENLQKKRKRAGLTQGLVPGKKVMKKYMNQKS